MIFLQRRQVCGENDEATGRAADGNLYKHRQLLDHREAVFLPGLRKVGATPVAKGLLQPSEDSFYLRYKMGCPSVGPALHRSVCAPVRPSIGLSVRRSVRSSVRPSVMHPVTSNF